MPSGKTLPIPRRTIGCGVLRAKFKCTFLRGGWPNLWLRPAPVFHRPKQLELHDSTESKGGDSWCLETKKEKELFFLKRNGLYVRSSNDVARLVSKLSRWRWGSITQNKASFISPLVGLTRTTWYQQRGFEHNQMLPRFPSCPFSRGRTMTQRSYLDTALHSLWSLLGENLTDQQLVWISPGTMEPHLWPQSLPETLLWGQQLRTTGFSRYTTDLQSNRCLSLKCFEE